MYRPNWIFFHGLNSGGWGGSHRTDHKARAIVATLFALYVLAVIAALFALR